jgi:hypothetical protein
LRREATDLKALQDFIAANWGNIASLAGLFVSFVTLLVARKAKQSADAAKREVRKRNRAEDLHEAQTNSQQIGLFIRDAKWDIVFLRAQEIASVCSLFLSRWNDDLSAASRTQIVLARDQAGSIARAIVRAGRVAPTEQQVINMSAAQRRLDELLSSELGESLRVIEKDGRADV